ncbi:MAG: GTPase [Coriobacteriia bacterium]|nr:GTPase [Coriobacteriia bacterium]
MSERRIVIMGAAGRDFHDFLVRYRDDESVRVVAFTATQIPGIDSRTFPAELAGSRYPEGIPIVPESTLWDLIREEKIDEVVFAYSDVTHEYVMHHAQAVIALGADFTLLGAESTMIKSTKPVISVCAVRTGVGKSGISRYLFKKLRERGVKAVDIRHPMPYRDLNAMAVERYASLEDLDRLGCTIEEREEYEPLIEEGAVVMAGVDYERILREAEKEADVIVWDGGNNDLPFYHTDLEIVALDPHRAGHERLYHPGEANFLRATVLVINKVDSADPADVAAVRASALEHNPCAIVVETDSVIEVDESALKGKRVLVIEDGPTVTHGGMPYGAGAIAARRAGAAELIDPRPFAIGSIKKTLEKFPHLTEVLPAMGYSEEQLADLEATVQASGADIVLVATPVDLSRLVEFDKPSVRAQYHIAERGMSLPFDQIIDMFCSKFALTGTPRVR